MLVSIQAVFAGLVTDIEGDDLWSHNRFQINQSKCTISYTNILYYKIRENNLYEKWQMLPNLCINNKAFNKLQYTENVTLKM